LSITKTGALVRCTGAGIPHFTGRSLDKVVFPLAPLAEQRRIVAKVDQWMVLVGQLGSQLAASLATGEKLSASLNNSFQVVPASLLR
jgi:hypothetical protein